ncbi:MAG: type II toxin-antitoxin system RelE/ParE family toxin [archaeon]|nr:type II toxin-antitoxin system RelE/ParE family toxin [archaeon]
MKYRIIITNTFDRGMRRLMLTNRQRARQLIKEIQANPYAFKELGGKLRGLRSARFGDYRIIFAIDERQKVVILFSVRPRERVYE